MAEKHFYEQKKHTESYLLPYFERHLTDFQELNILEVGCAEGGFLDVLFEKNVPARGLELSEARVNIAKAQNPKLDIMVGDITDAGIVDAIADTFDLVVMRDTIEHIPNRTAAFGNISRLLKKQGHLYVTFPPRFSGFAGHQQNAKSIFRFIPYLQLLPAAVIKTVGKMLNERPKMIEEIILNYRVGLTIGAFERYYSAFNFHPVVKELFLVRPTYKLRFDLAPKRIPNIWGIREFAALGCEYLLRKSI